MATEIRQTTCVLAAGTTQATAQKIDMSMPPRRVDTIEIIVPPGPSGLVGFQIAVSGQPVIPYSSAEWIVTANEKIVWPLDNFPNSGSWQLIGYNTGTTAHAIYVRFLVNPTDAPAAAPAVTATDADLSDNSADDGSDTSDTITDAPIDVGGGVLV